MQQLALMAVTLDDERKLDELEWERFRRSIVATHPYEAQRLLKIFDGDEAEPNEFAAPLSEEDFESLAENYVPLGEDDVSGILESLRGLGFHIDET